MFHIQKASKSNAIFPEERKVTCTFSIDHFLLLSSLNIEFSERVLTFSEHILSCIFPSLKNIHLLVKCRLCGHVVKIQTLQRGI